MSKSFRIGLAILSMVVFFTAQSAFSQDTLINVVQWTEATGGNGHWYGIVAVMQPWDAQRDLAASLTYDGEPGHLATIASTEENEFIVDSLLAGHTNQPSLADEFYLGGERIGLEWQWITGEPFAYSNWKSGEPSGDGPAMAIWGASYSYVGQWNDLVVNPLPDTNQTHWAVVEFGVDSPPGDSLIFPSMSVARGDTVQSVQSNTTQPIRGVTVPVKIPAFGSNFSISTQGLITQDWDYQITQVKEDSGFIFVALFNTFGEIIPPGVNTLFNIRFDVGNPDCENELIAHWDTALMRDPSRQLIFSDTNTLPIYPAYNINRDAITIAPGTPGDVDNSGIFDISDLIFAVDFMFGDGPAPLSINTLDVNGDCRGPDISDLIRMVDNIFTNHGQPIECGCIATGKRAEYMNTQSVSLYTVHENSTTSLYLQSDAPIRGVQFSLSVSDTSNLRGYASSDLELMYGINDGILKAGLLDMNGSRSLPAGKTKLLQIDGDARVLSALVADGQNGSVIPVINEKLDNLPSDYELVQNYPNPFNPDTKIQFNLPSAGKVLLTVININGQKVTTLVDRSMDAGVHVVTWDGRNETGASVASGVYFYRIDVNGFQQTKKMMLLK
ncbi:MAG TPA: T9SS type A sorting domain-containing protein [candidate division Zixibacteria bacterium]|nr:T9SS type A sorting domain-containing protein [candidate division Zixibacteria bacterium]